MQFLSDFAWKLIIFCHAFVHLDGARLLFLFPMPFKSHVRTFSVLSEALAKRGHEVTFLTSIPSEKDIPNYREIVIDKKLYGNIEKEHNISQWVDLSAFQTLHIRWTGIQDWNERALASKPVQQLVSSQDQYDVILGEFLMFQEAFLAFAHRFNAPFIELAPQHLFLFSSKMLGYPHSFAYSPDPEVPYTERMSFMERLHNIIFSLYRIAGTLWYNLPKHEELARKHLRYPGSEERPPLRSLLQNVSLVLANTHFSFHYPRPVSPNIIEIGGFHVKPPDTLPADLQSFMDAATEGVVLVSFGTHIKANMISKEREATLVSAFMALKQRVIWRWDDASVSKDQSKVMIKDWIPQTSILAHPNCVLFITHGGLSSLIEAIHFGVPLIGIPFMLDQFHNVEYVEKTGIGLKLHIYANQEDIVQAVTQILSTPSFKEKMKEQSMIMRDQPQSPLDRAIFWIEYVIRHKGAHHLKPASVYLPFYQYILLDVIAFITAVFTAAIFVFWKIFTILCRRGSTGPQMRKSKYRQKTD